MVVSSMHYSSTLFESDKQSKAKQGKARRGKTKQERGKGRKDTPNQTPSLRVCGNLAFFRQKNER